MLTARRQGRREPARHSDGAGSRSTARSVPKRASPGGAAGRADGRGSRPPDHCVGRHEHRDGAKGTSTCTSRCSSGTRSRSWCSTERLRTNPDHGPRTWSPRVHDDAWSRRSDECRTRERRRGRRSGCKRSCRPDGTRDESDWVLPASPTVLAGFDGSVPSHAGCPCRRRPRRGTRRPCPRDRGRAALPDVLHTARFRAVTSTSSRRRSVSSGSPESKLSTRCSTASTRRIA